MGIVTIGDVAKLVRGVSYKKEVSRNEPSKNYVALLRANNIVNGTFSFEELVYVPSFLVNSEQFLDEGDIMITMSSGSKAHVGKVALSKTKLDCVFGAFCAKIKTAEAVLPKYLYYVMLDGEFRKHIEHQSKGTNINNLKRDYILGFSFNLPPLEEQQRIVSRIEELFSELDAAVATLEWTKEQLAVYRQAVLKEAFANIKEVQEMGNLASMIDPQPSHRTPPEIIDGIPYVGIGDIDYTTKQIDFISARKVHPTVLEEHLNRYILQEGDFIMGKIGTIGKPYVVPTPQNYALSANVILIQPDRKKILPSFLYWQFSSIYIIQQLEEGSKATTQPAFGIKKARKLLIKICPFEMQEKIVSEIESCLSICDNIEETVTTALQEAEAMRQSILKQAFSGEL